MNSINCEVRLHNFNSNGICQADVRSTTQDYAMKNITVSPSAALGLRMMRPSRSIWTCSDPNWRQVMDAVAIEYAKNYPRRITSKINYGIELCFYAFSESSSALVNVQKLSTGAVYTELRLFTSGDADSPYLELTYPRKIKDGVEKHLLDDIRRLVIKEYRRQLLHHDISAPSNYQVSFGPFCTTRCANLNITLPNGNVVPQYLVYKVQNNAPQVIPPFIAYDQVHSYLYPSDLKCAIQSAFDKVVEEYCFSQATKSAKNVNHMGRVHNANHTALRFVPRTVLYHDQISQPTSNQAMRNGRLIQSLELGPNGGIGPIEISLLYWINQLRYATKPMLSDLIEFNYVNNYDYHRTTGTDLHLRLMRMEQCCLVDKSHFICMNDDLDYDQSRKSSSLIFTTARSGGKLLRELGKPSIPYSAFDLYQDGNTVKRYLSANQWLIYWLKVCRAAKEGGHAIRYSFSTHQILKKKDTEFSSCQIYASITIDDHTMAAEPVRRVDEEDAAEQVKELQEKLPRISNIFSGSESLYSREDRISFPRRPILVFVCEDDEHVKEIFDVLSPVMEHIPEQTVWFTADQRIFNRDVEDYRFLTVTDGKLCPISACAHLGYPRRFCPWAD